MSFYKAELDHSTRQLLFTLFTVHTEDCTLTESKREGDGTGMENNRTMK